MMALSSDSIKWHPKLTVIKYHPDQVAAMVRRIGHEPSGAELRRLEAARMFAPDEIVELVGNLLTTAGLNRITNLIIGGGAQALTNSRAIVGVGSGTTGETVGDAALAGNGNSASAWYRGADASNPTQANGVITCASTFGSTDANFNWAEWCLGIATAAITPGNTFATVSGGGVMLNRKVQSAGSKASGSIWTASATITLS